MEQDRIAQTLNEPRDEAAPDSLVDFLMSLPEGKARSRVRDPEALRLEALLARRMRSEIGARLRDDAA